jgi:metal-responsive CopG/Arc/MetJ family transcriptional regulator
MASSHPRVQVTVDRDLAAAMEAVDPHPQSRSRLIRDLAIRGAEAERDERERREQAMAHLLSISSGETDYDFDAARAIHAEREAGRG